MNATLISVYQDAIKKRADDASSNVELGLKDYYRAVSCLYASMPYSFLANLSSEEQAEFEDAVLQGAGVAWAKRNGYVTNRDIPKLAKHLLEPHVDFSEFANAWLNAQMSLVIVAPEAQFLDTNKTWLEHIAKHAIFCTAFRHAKRSKTIIHIQTTTNGDQDD